MKGHVPFEESCGVYACNSVSCHVELMHVEDQPRGSIFGNQFSLCFPETALMPEKPQTCQVLIDRICGVWKLATWGDAETLCSFARTNFLSISFSFFLFFIFIYCFSPLTLLNFSFLFLPFCTRNSVELLGACFANEDTSTREKIHQCVRE